MFPSVPTKLRPSRNSFIFPVLLLLALIFPTAAWAKYASIVIEAETGEVLHAANADVRNYPASLTKMMTLYMAFDALDNGKLTLNQRLPVSAHASGQAPSKLGLKPGETIRVEDCILALVTKSANDCAVVLAEAIGGSEAKFARMMTDKARSLGMTRTTFRNANGLPNAGQLSTARDMARLSQALIQDHKKYYPYFSTRTFTYKGVAYGNHNRLMSRYNGMDGLKTGFIRASGFNLAASAVRDGRRLIAVVFGGETPKSRDDHLASLLDRAFSGKTTPVLVAAASGKGKKATKTAPSQKPETVLAGTEPAPKLSFVSTASAATLPPADTMKGSWGIQVGAFSDQSAGQRAAEAASRKAPSLLSMAVTHVQEVATGKGTIFRARLMGLDEKAARKACATLAKAGQKCLTVPPQQQM